MIGLATDSEARVLFLDAIRFLVESLGAEGGLVLYGRDSMRVQSIHGLKRDRLAGEAILNQDCSAIEFDYPRRCVHRGVDARRHQDLPAFPVVGLKH